MCWKHCIMHNQNGCCSPELDLSNSTSNTSIHLVIPKIPFLDTNGLSGIINLFSCSFTIKGFKSVHFISKRTKIDAHMIHIQLVILINVCQGNALNEVTNYRTVVQVCS